MNSLLQGFIYHMLTLENLLGVFTHQNLFSKEQLQKRHIVSASIANEEVQNLRKRIFVFDIPSNRYRALHSYVPFYFTTHTPMLKAKHRENILHKIVFLEVSRTIISRPGVLFTDGNASNQQLSK